MTESIAVVGAGQMGSGIAHVAALSGHSVTMIDVADAALEKGRSIVAANLDRQEELRPFCAPQSHLAVLRETIAPVYRAVGCVGLALGRPQISFASLTCNLRDQLL